MPGVETLTEATERLQAAGYVGNFVAASGGHLQCAECGFDFPGAEGVIDEVVRFEGPSDPADEAVLFAISGPCDHRGVYTASFGPYATADDDAVFASLRHGG
jgi:hypothetical protein